jgi:nicotinamidase-related amidase
MHSNTNNLSRNQPIKIDNGFYGTPMEPVLRAQQVDTLVVAGVSTTWAVQSLVRDALDRDFRVFVIDDACAAVTAEEHQASIEMLRSISTVISIADLPDID